MYAVIQFAEGDGGTLSVVNNNWLTPRRNEVRWPPAKGSKEFDRILASKPSPNEKWKLYGVQRVFYETDSLDKAKQKLKLVEVTSDIATEDEGEALNTRKRLVKPKNRYCGSDSEEDEQHERPPPLKKKFLPSVTKDNINILSDITWASKLHSTPKKQYIANTGLEKSCSKETDVSLRSLPTLPELPENPKLPENSKTKIVLTDTIISLLSEIKVQNQKIIALLTNSAHTYYEPLHEDFKFPIQNEEEMRTTETLLAEDSKRKHLVSYLKSLGGREVKDKVTKLMKFTLADNLARQYNYYGKRSDKKPFSESRLRHCVIEAVKATTAKVTDREIEDTIKNWLKHAPEREKKRLSRNASQEDQQD